MSSSSPSPPLVKPVELPGRGRALVATRLIKPGEVLLSDTPLLLYPASLPSSTCCCSHCFRSLPPSSTLFRCPSACSSSHAPSVFCSSRCLSAHPPFLCLALSRLPLPSLRPDLLQPAFFLLAAYNLAVSSPSDFGGLLSLHGSPAGSHDVAAVATTLHSLVASVLPSVPSGFSPDLTAALLAKDRANAFGLMEPFDGTGERRVRSYGIYPSASLFNHDCLPNACRFDYLDSGSERNTDIVVRALHDIPEGREVCLSYFPVNWRYAERQKRLLEDYGFLCECDRCRVEREWKDEEDEEDDGMEEEEGEEEVEGIENMDEANDEGDGNFPHAYFFMRYLCDRENCGGTLAPLQPSPAGIVSNVMECNVCGQLRTEEDMDKDGVEDGSGVMLD